MADDGLPNTKPAKSSIGHIAPSFNSAATEIEIKFLVNNNDLSVFNKIRDYFRQQGWIRFEQENNQLLTRQLDTFNHSLHDNGHSIRMRGSCIDNDLSKVVSPDVCIKTGKTADVSGALHRGEFEARITSFDHVMLSSLKRKYPRAENPQLYNILDTLNPRDLREYFRIDCMRSRYLIDIPEQESGLPGKKVIAEVEMDDIIYVLDMPGLEKPLIFHADMEIEAEIKFKPCEYTESKIKDVPVSSPLTPQETAQAMIAIKRHINKGAGLNASGAPNLRDNDLSKAERGFEKVFPVYERLSRLLNSFKQDGEQQIPINHHGVEIHNLCDLKINDYFSSFREVYETLLPDMDFSDVAKRRAIAMNHTVPPFRKVEPGTSASDGNSGPAPQPAG